MLILHLSDIHFRKSEVSTTQDPNYHLRNELLRDAEAQCKELGAPDVVLVSGDIAFAGQVDEFLFATDWLRTLCGRCGCPLTAVFVVPGNHDVVRTKADSPTVQSLHSAIKNTAHPRDEITKLFLDGEGPRLLLDSLANYNNFALQFFCDLYAPDRTIAKRDIQLNDGSILRLWGLNTALVSSSKDTEGELFVDSSSFQISNEVGVVNLVMAHHPFNWLREGQALEDHLNDVAAVQIFGHTHTNRVNLNRDYVRFSASAANPERHEAGWEPGYNLIKLEVSTAPTRVLKIEGHIRVWQTAPGKFIPKQDRSSPVYRHEIQIGAWAGQSNQKKTVEANVVQTSTEPELSQMAAEQEFELRELALKFYRLSFSQKSAIAGRLGLFEDSDVSLPDVERFRRVFIRAHERGKLKELAAAIQNHK
ncbi:metallophosphoesterase [Shewanella oncorhynchi]|uniref:metallophosphoesterase n=1 Tax=Shewanella oncorhynchi TaxID=2726434 RepID=UPI003D7B7959